MFRKNKKQKIKPDYQRKNLKNPFFKQKKQGRADSFWRWLALFILVLVIGTIWFFFASSVWVINKVSIQGLTRIDENEIKQVITDRFNNKSFLFFSKNNIFLFPKDEVLEEINERYNFSQVEIKKSLPRSLQLIISERPYAFIFKEGSDFYYASKDAFIIKEEAVKEEDLEKYFILENKSQAVFINSINQINIKNDYLEFAFSLNEALKNYPDLKAERFIIDQELNSLTVKFLEGPMVYFNIKNNPAEQLVDLDLVKKQKIGDNFNSINYIDLRYGSRIYIN